MNRFQLQLPISQIYNNVINQKAPRHAEFMQVICKYRKEVRLILRRPQMRGLLHTAKFASSIPGDPTSTAMPFESNEREEREEHAKHRNTITPHKMIGCCILVSAITDLKETKGLNTSVWVSCQTQDCFTGKELLKHWDPKPLQLSGMCISVQSSRSAPFHEHQKTKKQRN